MYSARGHKSVIAPDFAPREFLFIVDSNRLLLLGCVIFDLHWHLEENELGIHKVYLQSFDLFC